MALLDPKMGLRLWDQLNDPYDHAQLADNFSKIGFHDHTFGRGVQIPTEGLLDGAVTGAKLDTSVLSSWRNVTFGNGQLTSWAAGSYPITTAGVVGGTTTAAGAFYLDPADYALAGKTTEFRVRGMMLTNATAPTGNWTFDVQQITAVAGGAGANTPTLLAIGNTASLPTPAANSRLQAISTTFTTVLVAGWYMLMVTTTTTNAANAAVVLRADLQVHNI